MEKPVVALVVDNSQSVVARGKKEAEVNGKLEEISTGLINLGIEVERINLEETSTFSVTTSNLSSLIHKAEERLKNKNFVGMIFASDGIFNKGKSPVYDSYLYPVFTIGLGDTIPPKDISISRSLFNRITYKGNETPIRLEITQNGYMNKEVIVQLIEGGHVLEEQKLRLRKSIQEVEFTIKSASEGLRHMIAKIPELPDESTAINNVSNIFMEVIDDRKRVLIVANSPHPDIRAIRTTLDETGNYETQIYISSTQNKKPIEIFDVIVFHGAFTSGIHFEVKENPGLWYILSNESSITSMNKDLSFINIERKGSRPDKVVGSFNHNFSKFKIEDVSAFEEYPPIEVPFGDYHVSGPVEVLMYQKLGNIKTQKPLMVVYDDGLQKMAVTMGQNIWRWKLQESAINENSGQFNNLITKTIQFLAVSNDQNPFFFRPRKTNYTNNESILFEAEVYNDIYERIYGNSIEIKIIDAGDSTQSFNFIDSEYNPTFRAPYLTSGIYQYEATTQIGDQRFSEKGEFAVQEINPEFLILTANHLLLKNLAKKSGGSFRNFAEAEDLLKNIRAKKFKSKIKSEEDLIPLYQTWWWYLIIFTLFSIEWFLRKYWGGY